MPDFNEWTKSPPDPPTRKPSQYYWFWDNNETEPWVVEVWPNRYLDHFEGWWSIRPIDRPFTKPNRKSGSTKR